MSGLGPSGQPGRQEGAQPHDTLLRQMSQAYPDIRQVSSDWSILTKYCDNTVVNLHNTVF